MTKSIKVPRCQGYRRYGGAFTFGPVRWEQCKEGAEVLLTIRQGGEEEEMPACAKCWAEAKATDGIEIVGFKMLMKKVTND